ncbi:MAG: hypothetical protein Q8N26_22005 [Myxococcales bacterium]|nr:hypothetical protein [Myxococcales bacterium]
MKLSFMETMRGEVSDAAGRKYPVAFHVRTRQLDGGHFALEGVVHASAFGDEATCEGTLDLSVLPASIAYVVRWQAGGDTYELRGAKSPSALAPLTSMRVLPVTLSRVSRDVHASGACRTSGDVRTSGVRASDDVLASGTMTFDLFDLPRFLASWVPVPLLARRRFEARQVAVARRALVGDSP